MTWLVVIVPLIVDAVNAETALFRSLIWLDVTVPLIVEAVNVPTYVDKSITCVVVIFPLIVPFIGWSNVTLLEKWAVPFTSNV